MPRKEKRPQGPAVNRKEVETMGLDLSSKLLGTL
jgi:hypothetical protein